MTVLDLDGHAAEVVRRGGVHLELDEEGAITVVAGAQREHLGEADTVAVPVAEALARQLAGYRLATGAARRRTSRRSRRPCPPCSSCPDAAALDLGTAVAPAPAARPAARPDRRRRRRPVLELDLKESAQDGMGPHGLLIGATGSGKSELLRTLVLGLAATHPPDVLNFVLVDFKGGATFAGMSALGQVAAVITNLQDDEGLVARMHQALSGELNRRQELLRAAGNLVSVRDYERARQRGAPLAPLPNLLLVVDEFSELIAQREEFVDLFVQIGRLGRSLGLHLLLASQRLEEGKIRGLEAHLSYRIALRTFSAEESRAVLGVDEAYTLPSSPGHGLLRTDTDRADPVPRRVRLRPLRRRGGGTGRAARRPERGAAVPGVECLPGPRHLAAPVAAPAAEDDPTRPTVLSVMVDRIAAGGGRAHQVWLPPLDAPEPLDVLLGGIGERPGRGSGRRRRRELCVPIGTVDLPLPAAPRAVRRRPLRGRRPRRCRRAAAVGQVDRAADARRRARAARTRPPRCSSTASTSPARCSRCADLPHVGGVAGPPGARAWCSGWSPRSPRCWRTGSGASASSASTRWRRYRRMRRRGPA